MTEREALLEAKQKMKEDAKTIVLVVGRLLYNTDLTSSKLTRAWNIVQAMGMTFQDMLHTDKVAKFVAERERLYAAYGGLKDILKID